MPIKLAPILASNPFDPNLIFQGEDQDEDERHYKLRWLQFLGLLNALALFFSALILASATLITQQWLIGVPALTDLLASALALASFRLAKGRGNYYRLGGWLLVVGWLIAIGVGYAILGTALPLPLVFIIPIALTATLLGMRETALVATLSLLFSVGMYLYFDLLELGKPALILPEKNAVVFEIALVLICIPVIVALFVIPTSGLLRIIRRQNKKLQHELADRKRAEEIQRLLAEENAKLYQQAQHSLALQIELDQLKDLFLSVASHDLRTPLTAIKGYSQLILNYFSTQAQTQPEKPPEATTIQRHLKSSQALLRQSERMEELINQLLDLSRLQTGQLVLHYHYQANLTELVRQTVEQHQLSSEDHLICFDDDSHPHQLLADYDPARLSQVLDNLIRNAIKYSPPHTMVQVGIGLQVSSQTSTEPVALVWVHDQGYGISAEQQPYLFERFFRVRTAQTEHIEGLGLGLYICSEIIKQHGGQIWVESQPSQGSTFYFSLPLKAKPSS